VPDLISLWLCGELANEVTNASTTGLVGNDRYGLTQLANLGELPPTGAVIVVASLKLVDGTRSPVRVLALVPQG
jgi:kynurenine formamidase